ncbi:hypothetical protein F4604DRAFT_1680762 [Suillus subluteus]|nr:hypothetical protein F4604DRAFT_1684969 [Suillus subluteus]KAG1874882.1 hypothetical protein F4604DRAFT_1680762 [Suillus subluteus]
MNALSPMPGFGALALRAGLVTHNMRNDDHQVPSPEARVLRSRSRDSGLSEHFGDYRVPTPKFQLPGLRVAGTQESGVRTQCRQPGVPAAGTRELRLGEHFGDHRLPTPEFWLPGLRVAGTRESGRGSWDSSQVPGAGNPESQQPELGSQESVNILEITESQVPSPASWVPATRSPGSQNLGVGDLQNVHLSEINKCEHFGDHRLPTPNSRVPAAGTPGRQHLTLRTQYVMNILEITDSQLPTPGCWQPGVLAAGTQESGVTTW